MREMFGRGKDMVATASHKPSRKSVPVHRDRDSVSPAGGVRWDKKMSNNCAMALLVYTMLQIFFVVNFIKPGGMSIAPYFGLVVLVAIIIPFCRKYEKRWEKMAQSGLTGQSLAARFRKDQVILWLLALGLPFVLVALVKGISIAF